MLKITQLMRGEARAGTQAHGPPQTHVPSTGAGELEKHNKGPALKELGGWSGQGPAFWTLMHRRQSPLGSFWDCVWIIDYFRAENHSHQGKLPGASDAKAEFSIRSGVKPVLGWTPGGSGRQSRASQKGASALLVSALPHLHPALHLPFPKPIARRCFITTNPLIANRAAVLLIRGPPDSMRGEWLYQRFSACTGRRCPASARGLIRSLSSVLTSCSMRGCVRGPTEPEACCQGINSGERNKDDGNNVPQPRRVDVKMKQAPPKAQSLFWVA